MSSYHCLLDIQKVTHKKSILTLSKKLGVDAGPIRLENFNISALIDSFPHPWCIRSSNFTFIFMYHKGLKFEIWMWLRHKLNIATMCGMDLNINQFISMFMLPMFKFLLKIYKTFSSFAGLSWEPINQWRLVICNFDAEFKYGDENLEFESFWDI